MASSLFCGGSFRLDCCRSGIISTIVSGSTTLRFLPTRHHHIVYFERRGRFQFRRRRRQRHFLSVPFALFHVFDGIGRNLRGRLGRRLPLPGRRSPPLLRFATLNFGRWRRRVGEIDHIVVRRRDGRRWRRSRRLVDGRLRRSIRRRRSSPRTNRGSSSAVSSGFHHQSHSSSLHIVRSRLINLLPFMQYRYRRLAHRRIFVLGQLIDGLTNARVKEGVEGDVAAFAQIVA
mmetsp:Transcript_14576/g.27835  ORF Transcript_14576/g.27835 Transcript_14576/m.27835 type:complete len:231 (+) Transcript_14576:568-1260(+)